MRVTPLASKASKLPRSLRREGILLIVTLILAIYLGIAGERLPALLLFLGGVFDLGMYMRRIRRINGGSSELGE